MSPILPSVPALRHRPPLLPAAIAALAATTAPAQEIQQPPPATAQPAAPEEVVTLDEFQVSTSSIKEAYIATESTSGTRFSEKIADLPYSIQAFTSEFITDFQVFTDDELMTFVGGASSDPDGPSFMSGFSGRVRGFPIITTRDGFQLTVPATVSNTKETEFIKGPLSTLYGRAQPGGFLNKVTRRPGTKPHASFQGTYGTVDSYRRVALTATGPVSKTLFGKKLFYFTYFEYTGNSGGTNGPIYGEWGDKYYFGGALLYKFKKYTSLTATFEGQLQRNAFSATTTNYLDARAAGSFDRDANLSKPDGTVITPSYRSREWMQIGDYSVAYAPNANRTSDHYGLNLLFEHRFNNIWSHRSSLNAYTKDTDRLWWNTPSLVNLYDAVRDSSADGGYRYVFNGTVSQRIPAIQYQNDKSLALQAELLGVLRSPGIEHKLLFAIDASLRKQDDITYLLREERNGAPLYPGRYITINLDNPWASPGYGVNIPSNLADFGINESTDLTTSTLGLFASYRASLLRGRLALMASLRWDAYADEVHDYVNPMYVNPDEFDPADNYLADPIVVDGKDDGSKL
ncbi:MAG: hypothetical protein LBR12_03340, partial [Opitutaceae bacterium]|nr:hypothetical protein [Opitutaceae bacterium]